MPLGERQEDVLEVRAVRRVLDRREVAPDQLGEDARGEIYLMNLVGGSLIRIGPG